MHFYDESDGPTVTIVLPFAVADLMLEAIHRYVPASSGIDGLLIEELREQFGEQRGLADERQPVTCPCDGTGPCRCKDERCSCNDPRWKDDH